MLPPNRATNNDGQKLNIPMPTLGGKQFWQDVYVYAGWRIQRNVRTGHHRLLDPNDVRQASGSFEAAMSCFDMLKSSNRITPISRHVVVLIHGIARSTGTFSKMKLRLRAAGFEAVAISYPSTRDTIEAHAAALETLLNRLEDADMVSFVAHSMGGLVIRQLLAIESSWNKRMSLGRVIMIAPPNQGSVVARLLKNFPPYAFLYGKSGQQLLPETVCAMPVPDVPVTIIAGGRGNRRGFNPFLDGDDDGTVKVSETALGSTAAALIVPARHLNISNHEETIAATLRCLELPA
jgi:pimeloyl-ACP methyl ester carboxylesterase